VIKVSPRLKIGLCYTIRMLKKSLLVLCILPQLLFGLDLCSFLMSQSGVLTPLVTETKLDESFQKVLEEQWLRLTPRQRTNFKYAILNLKTFHQPKSWGSKLPKKFDYAYVKPTLFYGPQLYLRKVILDHPISRTILVHELVHLERLVSTNFYGESVLNYLRTSANLIQERYEEEVALIAEHRLIRSTYKDLDIPRLKEDYPIYISNEILEDLRRVGVIIGNTFISDVEIEKTLAKHPIYRSKIEAARRTYLNRLFLERVEKTLELSEKDFTTFVLDKYYKDIE